MFKRLLIMLVLVGLVFGGIFWFINFKGRMIKQYMAAGANPPQTVSSVKATLSEWLPTLSAVGSVVAFQGVNVSAEVPGIIAAIYFQQGDSITAGKPLLQLRAQVEQAKLKSLIASVEIARITYQRDQAQFRVKAVSQQVLDNDRANLLVATANVAEIQATLNKKTVSAPFSGVLGVRQVNVGEYLDAGKSIVTLQYLNSVFFDFFIPQQQLAKLKIGQKVSIHSDSYAQEDFMGTISVINPEVNVNTRNVLVRATVKNQEHKLLPGMYATVNVVVDKPEHVITLPRTAITFNPYGSTVYRIEQSGVDDKGKPKLMARQEFVTLGESRGDSIVITQGVKEGDTIVSSGQIKLHNGSVVTINNSVQPNNDIAPKPDDLKL